MLISRTSPVSGKTVTRDLDVTQEQLDEWKAGGLIQNVFPKLSEGDREFLLTGMTEEEWDSLFDNEQDD
jgi:hypothetical protein